MNSIHKFNLTENTKFKTHAEAKPLAAHHQNGILTLWMQVDSENRESDYQARIIGTGQDVVSLKGFSYVDTVQEESGIVWHIYIKELLELA